MKDSIKLPASGSEFRKKYWLKEELFQICKEHDLPRAGSKQDLLHYISNYIDGLPVIKKKSETKKSEICELGLEMMIIKNYSNDENHRAFFVREIGPHFKFNVAFMNWMKEHSGLKTYKEAIVEYNRILVEKKNGKKTGIGPQFEYNQYTKDFFADNPDLTRKECIVCCNHKKNVAGNHSYEKDDLKVLSEQETLILKSIPGMPESILEGMNEPLLESTEELDW